VLNYCFSDSLISQMISNAEQKLQSTQLSQPFIVAYLAGACCRTLQDMAEEWLGL
jgi:hypothetical protein